MNKLKIYTPILARGAYNLARDAYAPFFPTPRKKREAFMNQAREKVAFYKPKIEEKCGVRLGDVQVKDNKEWLKDILYGSVFLDSVEDAWKNGRTPREMDYYLNFIAAEVAEAILFIPTWLYHSFTGADFKTNNNIIYVPFNYMNRFMDINFKTRTKYMDYGIVHELSHTLWDKLSRNKLFEEKRDDLNGFGEERRWFEGFATYCADDYFAEFYPESAATDYSLPRLYNEGKKKIEEAVAKHGEGILLEIPKRWKELSNGI